MPADNHTTNRRPRWAGVCVGALFLTALPSSTAIALPPLDAPTVQDDGDYTGSTTVLHATWSRTDSQLNVAEYRYEIVQGSISGPTVVSWSSTGKTTSVTRTGLTLQEGQRYFFGVKAVYGPSVESAIGYSDGITVDTTPPTLISVTPAAGPTLYADSVLTISAAVTDTDPSPLSYQFSIDGTVKQSWSSTATYGWATTAAMAGPHTVKVEVRDVGGSSAKTQTLYLYLQPPGPP